MFVSVGLALIPGNFYLVSNWLAGSGEGRHGGWPEFAGFPGLKSLVQWFPQIGGVSSDFDAMVLHNLASP
jgi:hypothetical protein